MVNEIDPLSAFDEITSEPGQNRAKKLLDAEDSRKHGLKSEVIKALMEHERGREWIYDILERCHIFSTPFAEDPYRTSFNAGEQNIGNSMLADIVAFEPDMYVAMCREGFHRRKAIETVLKQIKTD